MLEQSTNSFDRKPKKAFNQATGKEAIPLSRARLLIQNVSLPWATTVDGYHDNKRRHICSALYKIAQKIRLKVSESEKFVDMFLSAIYGQYSLDDFQPAELRCILLQHLNIFYRSEKPPVFLPFPDYCQLYPPKLEYKLTTKRANTRRRKAILSHLSSWMHLNASRGHYSCGLSLRTMAEGLGCGKTTADFYLSQFVKEGQLLIARRGEARPGGKATEYCLPEYSFELQGQQVEEDWGANVDDSDWCSNSALDEADELKLESSELDEDEAAELEALVREFQEIDAKRAKEDPSHISQFGKRAWELKNKFDHDPCWVSC